jgi:hypothetical protein
MYYLQKLLIIKVIHSKSNWNFILTKHINATIASNICEDDERKKIFGPNDHAFIIISNTKNIIRLKLMHEIGNE